MESGCSGEIGLVGRRDELAWFVCMYVCTLHASTHMCSKRVRLLEKESKGREGGEAEEMTEIMYSVHR